MFAIIMRLRNGREQACVLVLWLYNRDHTPSFARLNVRRALAMAASAVFPYPSIVGSEVNPVAPTP